MKASNNFKSKTTVYATNTNSLDTLTDASGNSLNTIVSSAVSSGISGLAANVAADDITMAAMQTQISSTATTVSNLNTNIVSVSQRTATLEGRANATDTSIIRLDSSLNSLNTGIANLNGGNAFSNGLNVFTNGNNTAAQIVNLACSGNNVLAGGDKYTTIATGYISVGSASGTTTEIFNSRLKGNTSIYDNPLTYDTLVSISNDKHLTHKKYVDDTVATGNSNFLGTNNVFTTAQSYDPSVNATDPNNLVKRSYVSTSVADLKTNVYSFFSNSVFVGGATTTMAKVDDTHYMIEYPYTGSNNNTAVNINQNYRVKQIFLNLPSSMYNGVSVICRSATIRVRMELEFGSARSGYTSVATQNPSPHNATFPTEQFIANFVAPTGTNGHCYIESTICLALSGYGVNTVYFNVHGLSGTGLVSNNSAVSNSWSLAPQTVKWKNNSTTISWTPFQFICYTDSKIAVIVNLPDRLNNIGQNYWTVGYRYRVEILDSMPIISDTSSEVYSGIGFTDSNLNSFCGGAYFSDS